MRWTSLILVLALGVTGCVTPAPFVAGTYDSPAVWQIAENPEGHVNREVLWGGMILDIKHRERYTELEMLGFPLDARQQPQAELADEGRYILIVSGFLDPADFAVGRFLTFPGRITGARRGELRNEPYVWPMLDTLQPFLWPKDFREEGKHYSFGIGVRF